MQKQPIQDINNIMTSFYLALPSVMLYCLGLRFSRPCNTFNGSIIALHSDIWAIMLFVAGFVYMLCSALDNSTQQQPNILIKSTIIVLLKLFGLPSQHYFFMLYLALLFI
jgi:hypothetical protein